jgi:hypothetical protein
MKVEQLAVEDDAVVLTRNTALLISVHSLVIDALFVQADLRLRNKASIYISYMHVMSSITTHISMFKTRFF